MHEFINNKLFNTSSSTVARLANQNTASRDRDVILSYKLCTSSNDSSEKKRLNRPAVYFVLKQMRFTVHFNFCSKTKDLSKFQI